MAPTSPSPKMPTHVSTDSHEEIRRRYLAACAAGGKGTPPPDLDSFLAAYPEPERSQLRSELESLSKSIPPGGATATDKGDATIESPAPDSPTVDHAPVAPEPAPGGTMDYLPASVAVVEGTTDFEPSAPAGTADFVPADPQGTVDHVPQTTPEKVGGKTGQEPTAIAGYDILGTLGRGAMGVVYKARQRGLKRLVALKMILAGGHASEHELGRFRSEAEAVAQLHHPNIVQIYEVGEAEGKPFFSLEFVEGTTLDKKVRNNPLPAREAAQLCQQMAQAMDYAHKRGIIHRDLKPANILLATDGTPKISDFGLAKRLEEEDAGLTRAGTVLGTPSYMAPEQAEGKVNELGPLSDVYSLGAVLYDLLTGRAPFRGTTILETLEQVRTREPVPPTQLQPTVPRDLETICLKCLQKDPARRYRSAGEMAEDLDHFLKGEPILARPVGRVERTWRWCKRNPRMAFLGAGSALLLVAIVFLAIGWAVTSSLAAAALKVQTDEAVKQTAEAKHQEEIAKNNEKEAKRQEDNAKKNEKEAKRQEGFAKNNEVEAKRQEKKAKVNEKEALKQAGIARKNEEIFKNTAESTVNEMTRLGRLMQQRLQSKRFSVKAEPEMRGLREEMLNELRNSLKDVSKKIEVFGTSAFGEAAMCQRLGDLLVSLGLSEEALRVYKQGHDVIQRIIAQQPQSDQARANLGVMLLRLGRVPLYVQGDAQTARKYFQQSRDLHEDIRTQPRDGFFKNWEIKRILANDDLDLGKAYLSLGDPAQARKHFEDCLTNRQFWLKIQPKVYLARTSVIEAELFTGIAASFLADTPAMQKHLGAVLLQGAALVKEQPKFMQFRVDLAGAHGAYGDGLFRIGKVDEATKHYEEALTLLQAVVAANPDDLTRLPLLALTHERLGAAYTRLGKKMAAEKNYREALGLRGEVLQVEPGNLTRKAVYLVALANAGKHHQAADEAAKVLPLVTRSTELQLQLARCLSLCAAQESEQKAKYLEQALALLETVTQNGYKNVVELETDPDLQTLRDTPAFQKIMARVKSR